MIHEVDLSSFATAHGNGAYVVDVREPHEYIAGHVTGAVPMPLGQVPARMGELPTDRPVYVICASGNRSLTAAEWMNDKGVDAWSVAGGTGAWMRAGGPITRGAGPA
ncbi:rhodanese-like domain-containing protein [Actinocorallia sp. B10E7]|uniref:rhodanese-like domain-containing protein n=1 Tax=Actinocorallia sp. B10E7 TaxID=3153558 RepID=UPI00325CF965